MGALPNPQPPETGTGQVSGGDGQRNDVTRQLRQLDTRNPTGNGVQLHGDQAGDGCRKCYRTAWADGRSPGGLAPTQILGIGCPSLRAGGKRQTNRNDRLEQNPYHPIEVEERVDSFVGCQHELIIAAHVFDSFAGLEQWALYKVHQAL